MDRDRRKELTIARGVRVARKISRSKTGSVILKDNVLEGNKLGSELDQIDHLQKKQATKMLWEQEYLFRKQQLSLGGLVHSEPNLWKKTEQLTAEHLPPIGNSNSSRVYLADTVGHVEPEAQTSDHNGRTPVGMNKLSDVDESMHTNGSRKLSGFGVKRHKTLTRVRSTDGSSCLPALVSPHLLRRRTIKETNALSSSRDGTKDPRFSKLIESLVPSSRTAGKNLSEKEINECGSSYGSPTHTGSNSPRSDTPRPLSHVQTRTSARLAAQRFAEERPYSPIHEKE